MPSRTTRASLSSELGSGTTTPPVSASRRQSRRLSALESSPPDESLSNDGITRDSSGHILEVDDSEADDEILASSPVLSSRKRRSVATPKRAPATPAITSAISSSRKYKQAEVPDSEDPLMNDDMDSHVDVSGGELSSASKRRRVTRTTSSPIQKGKGKAAAVIKDEEEEVVDLRESEFEDESDGGGFIKDDSDSDALLKTAAAKRKTNKRKAPAKRTTPVRRVRAKKPIVIASDEDEAESSTAAARRRARASNGDLDALPDDYSDDEVISVESKSDYSDDEEEPEEEEEEVDGAATAPRRRRGQGRSALSYNQKTREALYNCHPALKTIFNELDAMPKREMAQAEQPEELTIKLLPFQREGLHWLVAQENSKYHGGILADEMGMGKTIQTIALLLSEPRGKPNLVVVPTVAIMQWKAEIESNTAGKLTTMVYHGASRTEDPKKLEAVDVIITSYNVLESVFRKEHMGFRRRDGVYKARSALHAITYHRVILDEAHNIKERQCNTAKAAFALKTDRRLCLSGTPLQNRIGELYSLIRFLRIEPFSNYFCKKCPCTSLDWMFSDKRTCDQCGHKPMQHANWFNTELLKPIQNSATQEARQAGMMKLHSILRHTLLRRTKLERADDLGLPPRIVDVRRDRFNEEEEDLYRSIYSDGKRRFSSYVAQGVVLNNYANIFTLITRMRQMADHPDLVLRRHGADNAEDTTLVCKICDDEAQEAIRAKCHHVFCRLCIREYVEGFDEVDTTQTLECPVCHVALVIDLTAPALEVDEETLKKGSIVNRIDMSNWRSSTKIEALVEELYKLRSDRQTIKSIVFSQFTSMLDLVEWRLRRAGFLTVKLQGSMTPTQRDNSIKYFMNTPSVEVFLVSLKAGGVALNLCEASQVFLLDPWWNPSVEWQSGDRVHRIGQHRPVRITRLIIEDSIESRIIELQEKKANMIRATIESDDSAMNRLTPADLEFLFMN